METGKPILAQATQFAQETCEGLASASSWGHDVVISHQSRIGSTSSSATSDVGLQSEPFLQLGQHLGKGVGPKRDMDDTLR